jgi:hypothetical protein
VQTIPASASTALVPVPVEPNAAAPAAAPTLPATAAVVEDAKIGAPVKPVPPSDLATETAAAEQTEDSALDNAAMGSAGFNTGLGLDHLALGWGVSTIGNGTLYPTPLRNGYGGGFGGIGGLGSSTGSSGTTTPSGSSVTYIVNNNSNSNSNSNSNTLPPFLIPPPIWTPPPHNTPQGVPEPASVLVWGAVGLAALAWGVRRKRQSAAA